MRKIWKKKWKGLKSSNLSTFFKNHEANNSYSES